jgi:hypothetical protein
MDSNTSYIGYIDLPEDKAPTFCQLSFGHQNETRITFLTEKQLFQSMLMPIIGGNFEGIGAITLINCRLIKYSTTFSKDIKYEYNADLLIKGMAFKSPEEIAPTEFAFNLENLNQWFFPNNFSLNYETSEPYLQKEYEFRIVHLSEMEITIKNRMARSFSNSQSQKRELHGSSFNAFLRTWGFHLTL